VADLAALDQFNHLARNAQDGVSAETRQHGFSLPVLGKARHLQGPGDDRRKVAAGDVDRVGPPDDAGGEDPLFVGRLGTLDAVGRHEDRPGERGEFFQLVLPGRSVMAVEMGVLLEQGIAVGGQHLAVGVDGNPLALGLLEQLFEVAEIVPGNEDRLPLLHPERNLGRDGMAVAARVAGVQQLHRPHVRLAALQDQPQAGVQIEGFVGQRRQAFVQEGVDRIVLLPQDLGVVRIGGDTLHAEEERVFQRNNVRIRARI